jgi:DNA polymerase III delta prime subunit
VRNKIKMFAQKKVTLPPGRHKIVILDEADRSVSSRGKGAGQSAGSWQQANSPSMQASHANRGQQRSSCSRGGQCNSHGRHNYTLLFGARCGALWERADGFLCLMLCVACSMTQGAQQALRRTMEIYSNTTRFALACNTSTKVSRLTSQPALLGRFVWSQGRALAAAYFTLPTTNIACACWQAVHLA